MYLQTANAVKKISFTYFMNIIYYKVDRLTQEFLAGLFFFTNSGKAFWYKYKIMKYLLGFKKNKKFFCCSRLLFSESKKGIAN